MKSARIFWIRLIQKRFKYTNDLPETWKQILVKTPIKILEKITAANEEFSRIEYFGYLISVCGQLSKSLTPLHIAAATGDLELSAYIARKIANNGPITRVPNEYHGDLIPKNNDELTSFLQAAKFGHFKEFVLIFQPQTDVAETPLHFAAKMGHL